MRLSELRGKEIINLTDATRLGTVAASDLEIDPVTGKIATILIPDQRPLFSFFPRRVGLALAWESIVRIGPDLIIIEIR